MKTGCESWGCSAWRRQGYGEILSKPFRLILEVINKQVEEKKVITSSQHGFTKMKSCLTNLITS